MPAGDAGSELPADKPWLSRKDWAAGVMRDNVGLHLDVYVVAFMGIAFLVASYGFYHELPRLAPDGGYGPFIPLGIFGLLGAGLTLNAVHLVLRWFKYGGSRLKLETVPIPLGGAFHAELIMSRPLRAGRQLRARLKCISATVTEGISVNKPFPTVDERHTEYRVIWEDKDALVSDGSGRLQIAFGVPADEPSTTLPNDRGWRHWVLEVEDPSGRAQAYHAEFELPVFQAALGAGEAMAVAAIVEARRRKLEDYKPHPGFKARIGPAEEGGTEFLLPPVRVAGGAISQSMVFLVSFVLMVAATGQVPTAVIVVWGVLNLLLCLWVARLWFAPERVVIGNGAVRVTSGMCSITQTMALDQVMAIHAVPIEAPWLVTIRIKGRGWHMIGAGQGIRERREAEWLAQQMSHAAGINPAGPIPGNESKEMLETIMALGKDMASKGLLPETTADILKQLGSKEQDSNSTGGRS